MKNTIMLTSVLAILTAVVAIAVVGFSIQNGDQTEKDKDLAEWDPHTPLSAKTELKIKQDYLKFYTKINNPDATVDDVIVWKYYGTNGSCVAVLITDRFAGHHMELGTDVVDRITIPSGILNKILVWENGNFHSLQEAHDKDLLTKDNLVAIGKIPYHDTQSDRQTSARELSSPEC